MARWMLGSAVSDLPKIEEIARVEGVHPGPMIPAMDEPYNTYSAKFIRALEKTSQPPSTLSSSTLYPGRVFGS